MPTYDYRCKKCDHKFEVFHSIKADPHTDCPECGSSGSVERLISAGNGLIFKGSGFYITDYKNNGAKSSSSSKKPDKKPKAKSDSKTKSKKAD